MADKWKQPQRVYPNTYVLIVNSEREWVGLLKIFIPMSLFDRGVVEYPRRDSERATFEVDWYHDPKKNQVFPVLRTTLSLEELRQIKVFR